MDMNDSTHSNRSDVSDASSASIDAELIALKNHLKNLKFTGTFVEKRFLNSLHAYRDRIVIAATEASDETAQFMGRLSLVRDKLFAYTTAHGKATDVWIGATPELVDYRANGDGSADGGWNIWTELPAGTPFDRYRFKIKTIRFRANEYQLHMCIVDDGDGDASIVGNRSRNSDGQSVTGDDERPLDERLRAFAEQTQQVTMRAGRQLLDWLQTRDYSWRALAEHLRMLAWALGVAILLAVQLVRAAGQVGMWLLVEARQWTVVLMPLLLRLVDLVRVVLGGLMLLVHSIWRDVWYGLVLQSIRPPPRPRNNQQFRRQAIQYR